MSRWKEGGFPDVTMSAPLPVSLALTRALNERAKAAGLKESGEQESMEEFSTPGWLHQFDGRLRQIARRYLDHRRQDWQNGRAHYWTWERMIEELKHDESFEDGPVVPGDAMLPELPAAWAHQRRRMVDLLRYIPVPYKVRQGRGATHTGIPLSPGDAWKAGWRGLGDENAGAGGGFYAYAEDIYGPDHGWKEGSYCVNLSVSIPQGVADSVPKGLRKSVLLRFFADLPPMGETKYFSDLGLGVRQGWHELRLNGNGSFLRIPPGWSPVRPAAPWPTPNKRIGVGFKVRTASSFADAKDFFEFYH